MTSLRTRAFLSAAAAGVLLLGACATPSTGAADGPAQARLAGAETTADSDVQIDPAPSGNGPVAADPLDAAVSDACAAVVPSGLTEVGQSGDEAGTASFWAAGQRWAVCDVPAAGDGALLAQGRGGQRLGERTLGLAAAPLGDGVRYAAGGRLPWPVDRIDYTFPDGEVATARFVEADGSTWWAVSHTAEEDLSALDPVVVEVVGGAAEAFTLPWESAQRSE